MVVVEVVVAALAVMRQAQVLETREGLMVQALAWEGRPEVVAGEVVRGGILVGATEVVVEEEVVVVLVALLWRRRSWITKSSSSSS